MLKVLKKYGPLITFLGVVFAALTYFKKQLPSNQKAGRGGEIVLSPGIYKAGNGGSYGDGGSMIFRAGDGGSTTKQ